MNTNYFKEKAWARRMHKEPEGRITKIQKTEEERPALHSFKQMRLLWFLSCWFWLSFESFTEV